MKRYAIVTSATSRREAEAYLPSNYEIIFEKLVPADRVEGSRRMKPVFVIAGEDVASWTLDGYVIPRYGSGMIGCQEIDRSHPIMEQVPTYERITDAELAKVCDDEGFPSVGDELASGKTQEEATAYMVAIPVGEPDDDESVPYFYDDPAGRWLKGYVEWLAECARV